MQGGPVSNREYDYSTALFEPRVVDLFAHQSSIRVEAFCNPGVQQDVELVIEAKCDGCSKAVDVIGLGK